MEENLQNKYKFHKLVDIIVLLILVFIICLILSTRHIYLSILGSLLIIFIPIMIYFIIGILIILILLTIKCVSLCFCCDLNIDDVIDKYSIYIIKKYNCMM